MQRWEKIQHAYRFVGLLRLAQYLATRGCADVGVWEDGRKLYGYSYGRLNTDTQSYGRLVAILRP